MIIRGLLIIVISSLVFYLFFSPKNEEKSFTVKLPVDWTVDKTREDVDLVAVAPPSDEEDLFRENMNVVSTELTGEISREEFYRLNQETVERLLTDFDLEDMQEVDIGGKKGQKISYSHRIGPVNLNVIQYLLLDGLKVYVITFTSDSFDYANSKEQFEQIASTFALVN